MSAGVNPVALDFVETQPRSGGTVYQVERWPDLREEMLPILVQHWYEVALDQDRVPLDIDEERYAELDRKGALHIVTARRDGDLIGYHAAIFTGHLHYKSTMHYITDVYYIKPVARHGITAIRLFQAVEKEAQRLLKPGQVLKFYTAVKLHIDHGRLFEKIGYRPIERLYSKIIEGKT